MPYSSANAIRRRTVSLATRTVVSCENCWRTPPAFRALEPEQTAPRSATTTRRLWPASSEASEVPATPAPMIRTSHDRGAGKCHLQRWATWVAFGQRPGGLAASDNSGPSVTLAVSGKLAGHSRPRRHRVRLTLWPANLSHSPQLQELPCRAYLTDGDPA